MRLGLSRCTAIPSGRLGVIWGSALPLVQPSCSYWRLRSAPATIRPRHSGSSRVAVASRRGAVGAVSTLMAERGGSKPDLDVSFDVLTPKNMEQLKILNAALFPVNYQDGFYRECCAAGDVTQLAYHNDVLVGAIACRLELQPDFTAKVYVMTIGVLAPYRGLGLGRALMERALGAAMKNPQIKSAYLHLQQTNEEAASFYKKFGFRESEVVKDYYRLKDGRDALILTCSLTEEEAPPPAQPQQQEA